MPPKLRVSLRHLSVLVVLSLVVTVTLAAQTLQGPTTVRQNVRNDVSLPLRVMVKTAPPPDLTLREVEPMKQIPASPRTGSSLGRGSFAAGVRSGRCQPSRFHKF